MNHKPKIGLRITSLGLDFRESLDKAANLGMKGVRLDVGGPIDPRTLSGTGRREILSLLRGRGLEGFALGSGLRHALDEPQLLEERLARISDIFTLAVEIQVKSVILNSGNPSRPAADPAGDNQDKESKTGRLSPLLGGDMEIFKPKTDPQRRFQTLLDSLDFVARLCERTGITPVIDPGGHSVLELSDLLKDTDHPGCGIQWDPATQMAGGRNPATFLDNPKRIVERPLMISGRDWIRNLATECIPGQGDLDWQEIMINLAAAGFAGPIIADRTSGNQPGRELLLGAKILADMIP